MKAQQVIKVNKAKAVSKVIKVDRDAFQPPVAMKVKRVNIQMPKNPERGQESLQLDNVRIYTDIKQGRWRVQATGRRRDKGFSFTGKASPKADNWRELIKYVNSGQYV